MRAVHAAEPGNRAGGAPRMTAALNDDAEPQERVNHKRVARVMAAHGIVGIRLRRRVLTTIGEPADEQGPDLQERDFTADAPNVKSVRDITYLPCAAGQGL